MALPTSSLRIGFGESWAGPPHKMSGVEGGGEWRFRRASRMASGLLESRGHSSRGSSDTPRQRVIRSREPLELGRPSVAAMAF
jgi:hypothetical protein